MIDVAHDPITEPSLAALHAIVQTHPIWSHSFILRCQSGELSLRDLRALAPQMYRVSKAFTQFLAGALARCEDDQSRIIIAQNLWEELGDGDPRRAHPELFRQFTRALGIDDHALERTPIAVETAQLLETYRGLPARHGFVGAVAAICFASEGLVSALYTHLETGIRGALPLDPASLVFFTVHIGCDNEHARALRTVVLRSMIEPADRARAVAAVSEALDARRRFFDGIVRITASPRAERTTLPPQPSVAA